VTLAISSSTIEEGDGLTDLNEVKRELEQRLDKLTERTTKIESHLRKPGNPDWSERATETENDQVLEEIGRVEQDEIVMIRAALSRIEAGQYGICAVCGEEIAEGRLKTIRFTTRCIDCAE